MEYGTWRLYAGGDLVFEDDFEEADNSQPYYDDYSLHEVPMNLDSEEAVFEYINH